jgi:hypothetical protein
LYNNRIRTHPGFKASDARLERVDGAAIGRVLGRKALRVVAKRSNDISKIPENLKDI